MYQDTFLHSHLLDLPLRSEEHILDFFIFHI